MTRGISLYWFFLQDNQETDLYQSQNESDNKKPNCIWTSEYGCTEISPSKLPLFLLFNHIQTGWDGGFTTGVVLPPLLPQTPLPLFFCMCFKLEQWWVGEARATL